MLRRNTNPIFITFTAKKWDAFYFACIAKYLGKIRREPCVYCGEKATTRDHIVPKSQGGSSTWENYAPACDRCNSWKDSQKMLIFLVNRRKNPSPPRPKRKGFANVIPSFFEWHQF